MKVIIAGSRNFELSKDPIACSAGHKGNIGCIIAHIMGDKIQEFTEVVSGNSGIIDLEGELWGALFEKKVTTFPADWAKHGRAAGPIRNREMAEYADALILIWDGKSRGSASMKREAKRAGIPIYEYNPNTNGVDRAMKRLK